MTQAQQSDALTISTHLRSRAKKASKPGNIDTLSAAAANELERLHARIQELEAKEVNIEEFRVSVTEAARTPLLNRIAELQQGWDRRQIAEPWKDHRTAALVNDLRDCAKAYASTEQLRERIATIVAPLCDQLKAAERAQRAAAPQAVQPAVPGISFDFKQAHELLEMFGGEPGEVTVGVGDGHSGRGLYAVWDVAPEVSIYLGVTDDEAAPAHPAEGVPAQFGAGVVACISKLNELQQERPWNLKQSEALSEAIAALEALAATQPAAQGLTPHDCDMFWVVDDPDQNHDTLHDAVVRAFEDAGIQSDGTVEIQCAKNIGNVVARITSTTPFAFELLSDADLSLNSKQGDASND